MPTGVAIMIVFTPCYCQEGIGCSTQRGHAGAGRGSHKLRGTLLDAVAVAVVDRYRDAHTEGVAGVEYAAINL